MKTKELFGLATAAAFGKWRDDERVTLTKTRQVTVQSSRDISLFLDGEKIRVGKNAEITFVQRAVNVIVPSLQGFARARPLCCFARRESIPKAVRAIRN